MHELLWMIVIDNDVKEMNEEIRMVTKVTMILMKQSKKMSLFIMHHLKIKVVLLFLLPCSLGGALRRL